MGTEVKPNHRPPKERKIEEVLEKDYYTIYEVADLLHFHHKTIRRMIASGELLARKYGKQWRIRKVDLEEFTKPTNAVKE